MIPTDPDYTLRYLHQTPRYAPYRQAILPRCVYPDPKYPRQVAIVELPFDLPIRCDRVAWNASRLSHRLPVYRPDQLNFFAVLFCKAVTGKKSGKSETNAQVLRVLFVGQDVFTIYQRWLYFVDTRTGKNLIQATYQGQTPPNHPPHTYEAQVVNYQVGAIYADHPHLRKVLEGITL